MVMNVLGYVDELIRKAYFKYKYRNINLDDVTILSNNCIGGLLYNRNGSAFKSPTINLQFPRFSDFLKFVNNMDYYIHKAKFRELNNNEIPTDIVEIFTGIDFPVAALDDIIICFQHYDSYDSAVKKWEERCLRINYDRIVVLGMIGEKEPVSSINDFEQLPYKHLLLSIRQQFDNRPLNLDVPQGTGWFEVCGGKRYQCYFDKIDYSTLFCL